MAEQRDPTPEEEETYENGPVPPDEEQGDPGTPEDPEDEDV